jgi:hypothetical protein
MTSNAAGNSDTFGLIAGNRSTDEKDLQHSQGALIIFDIHSLRVRLQTEGSAWLTPQQLNLLIKRLSEKVPRS